MLVTPYLVEPMQKGQVPVDARRRGQGAERSRVLSSEPHRGKDGPGCPFDNFVG